MESKNAELLRLLLAQRSAFIRTGAPDHAARVAALHRLDSVLRAQSEALITAIAADFGHRARPETILAEIMPIRAAIRHAMRNLARWMRPRRRAVALEFWPGRAWITHEPLGCIGIVAPWNYPLLLSIMPLIDAVAAGNRVMLKPSEHTPGFRQLVAYTLAQAFSADEIAVVEGDAAIGSAFCALPFDHLLFTGSTRIGKAVMRAAAENLVPVTLELGGKSPALVAPDYDMARAAHIIAVGKFFSAGQTCMAPDYALVPADQAESFAQAVIGCARRFYPTIPGNPDYTALISDQHRARLQAMLDEAEAAGARVLRHGQDGTSQDEAGRFAPAVVLNPPMDTPLMQEEIFGPILPVVGYQSVDQAIAIAGGLPRPLAFYPFTNNRQTAQRLLAGIASGGVTWNGTILHGAQPGLPFGGVGASGMGAYHGHAGFLRFSHARSIYKPGRFSGFTYMTPPHGRFTAMALRAMLRR